MRYATKKLLINSLALWFQKISIKFINNLKMLSSKQRRKLYIFNDLIKFIISHFKLNYLRKKEREREISTPIHPSPQAQTHNLFQKKMYSQNQKNAYA